MTVISDLLNRSEPILLMNRFGFLLFGEHFVIQKIVGKQEDETNIFDKQKIDKLWCATVYQVTLKKWKSKGRPQGANYKWFVQTCQEE